MTPTTRAVALLTKALVAAANEARVTERYIHGDQGVAREHLDLATVAARESQIAAQMAIYDLADFLTSPTPAAVAS